MIYSQQAIPDTPTAPEPKVPEGAEAVVQVQDNGTFSGRVTLPTPDANTTEQAPAKAAGEGERPSWLPEKFKSPEDLAKSYTELEKAYHSKGKAAAPAGAVPAIEKPATAEAPKGLDMDALSQEFVTKGALSEETYTKLAGQGMDRATVDTVIAGQQALAAGIRSEIATVAGGEEKLNAVLTWAKDKLPPAQVEAYNAAAQTKNVELVKLALSGIVAAHAAANPTEPSFLKGETVPTQGDTRPFQSNVEMVRAMQDKRYATDPAYRAEVARRIAVSAS